MNLLIVNGYDKNGWSKLAKYKLQPICEFYRDQLKSINPNIKTTFIYPSMDLNKIYEENFIKSFRGVVWTGSSLNIYDNTREIKNQISLMKKMSELKINMFGSCWGNFRHFENCRRHFHNGYIPVSYTHLTLPTKRIV